MSKSNLATIEELRWRLKPAFEKFPAVRFAYLFGSVAEGKAGPLSDIDIAVYLDPLDLKDLLPLLHTLCLSLKRDDVDLLVLNRTRNLILKEEIVRHGKLLYDKDPEARFEFEWKSVHQAIDFREKRKRLLGESEKIARVRSYLEIVNRIKDDCLELFDKDPIYRGALLHYLYLIADSCISLAQMMIKAKNLPSPQSYHEAIEVLGESGILEPDFARNFSGIAGFRNFLAHDYEKIDRDFLCQVILPKLPEVELYLKCLEATL